MPMVGSNASSFCPQSPDVQLEYKPTGTPPPYGAADIDPPGPDLFDAVQSQLGLKLMRRGGIQSLRMFT